MRVAVIDDEVYFAEIVKRDIEKIFQDKKKAVVVKCFFDASILDDIQEQNNYDLYLLDIEMPEINGLELAEKIRELDLNARIVFLTAYENYARYGYKVRAYDYLLKDTYQEELFLLFKQIQKEEKENQDNYYIISSDNKECKIRLNDILYLNKEKQYTLFHCQKGVVYRKREALQNVLKYFPKDRFIIIDKGTVINLKYVTQFEKYEITLESGELLPVSRRLKSAVQEKLTEYWGELC